MVANINRVNPDHQHIIVLHKRHKEWETGEIRSFRELYLYNIVFHSIQKSLAWIRNTGLWKQTQGKKVSKQHKTRLQSRKDYTS